MRLMIFAALLLTSCQGSPPHPTQKLTELFPVPAFQLQERSGRTVTNEDLKGNVWVASFVFTRCSGPCPQVSATIARLQSELSNIPNLKFITFTIDPERDTLDELKKYAERYRADPDRWLFLTGPESQMHEFATQGFKLLATKRKDPKPGDEFDHSSKLALVDRKGVIRGYYDGMPGENAADFEKSLQRLKADIAAIHNE